MPDRLAALLMVLAAVALGALLGALYAGAALGYWLNQRPAGPPSRLPPRSTKLPTSLTGDGEAFALEADTGRDHRNRP